MLVSFFGNTWKNLVLDICLQILGSMRKWYVCLYWRWSSHPKFFHSTIVMEKGCPFSKSLLGSCIYELEQAIDNCTKYECIEEFTIGTTTTVLLILANGVVCFLNTSQKFIHNWKLLCIVSWTLMALKQSSCLWRLKTRTNPYIGYSYEPL